MNFDIRQCHLETFHTVRRDSGAAQVQMLDLDHALHVHESNISDLRIYQVKHCQLRHPFEMCKAGVADEAFVQKKRFELSMPFDILESGIP